MRGNSNKHVLVFCNRAPKEIPVIACIYSFLCLFFPALGSIQGTGSQPLVRARDSLSQRRRDVTGRRLQALMIIYASLSTCLSRNDATQKTYWYSSFTSNRRLFVM